MLSRRYFLTITVIMLVLFGMFQMTSVLKEQWNDYGTNVYASDGKSLLTKSTAFSSDDASDASDGEYVLLIGDDADGSAGQMAKLWAEYQKLGFSCAASLSDAAKEEVSGAKLLFVDSAYLNGTTDSSTLASYADSGVSMVFMNLPDVMSLVADEQLMDLTGLYCVYSEDTAISGVELYEGFLLGGTSIYEAKTEEEQTQQDLTLHMPWYQVASGTKVYMTGLMEKDIANEKFPAIIWRNSIGSARVFVVAGDYASDVTALGIYSAMLCEMEDYTVYPVINAQNFVAANFAGLSSEQDDAMQSLYVRSQKVTFQDLIWPDLAAVIEKGFEVPTFYIAPQLDYTSGEEPDADRLALYMKLFAEDSGENGLTLYQTSDVDCEEKLKKDLAFYQETIPGYTFTSLYAESEGSYEAIAQSDLLSDIRTVCIGADASAAPVSYANEEVTLQRTTVDAYGHTYSDDLRTKSLETALGYSNIVADLARIVDPQTDEDRWETRIERISSYTVTYWKPFSAFDKTSITESDARIRQFLSVDYADERTDDVITLTVDKEDGTAYFILRTHNETVSGIEGGTCTEIEEHAYLIAAEDTTVKITVGSANDLYIK